MITTFMGYLYDYKHLLHETDDVGGEITNTYTATTDQEFGEMPICSSTWGTNRLSYDLAEAKNLGPLVILDR